MQELRSLAFTETALKKLAKITPTIRSQLVRKARRLAAEPHPPGSTKLTDVVTDDGSSVYRQRSGDYRILYQVETDTNRIVVLDIDHRKNVYRGL